MFKNHTEKRHPTTHQTVRRGACVNSGELAPGNNIRAASEQKGATHRSTGRAGAAWIGHVSEEGGRQRCGKVVWTTDQLRSIASH